MPCVCAKVTTISKRNTRLFCIVAIFISSNSSSGRAPESPRTNRSEDRTGGNGVGVLLCPRRLPHLLQAAARCRRREGESPGRGSHSGEAGLSARRQEDARLSQVPSIHRVSTDKPLHACCFVTRYGGAGVAALWAEEAEVAVPPSVPVRVAYELQLAGHRYLDVRTESEFVGGHPARAVNIPYMYSTGSGMAKNLHFLEQVSAIFGRDDEIIIGCQSGKRSLMAAAELCSAGFSAVTDMAGGFSTWRENGLPVNGR